VKIRLKNETHRRIQTRRQPEYHQDRRGCARVRRVEVPGESAFCHAGPSNSIALYSSKSTGENPGGLTGNSDESLMTEKRWYLPRDQLSGDELAIIKGRQDGAVPELAVAAGDVVPCI